MKRITNLIVCIFSLICLPCGHLFAQQPNPDSAKRIPSDESQAILKNLQKKWQSLQAVKIQFTLQSAKEGKNSAPIKGTLWSKGNAYKLSIPAQVIFCDGKNIWNYLPDNGEVSINTCEEQDNDAALSLNPLKIINDYEKYYRSAFIKETAEKGVAVQIIDLYPKQGQSFYKIRLVIQKSKQLPSRICFYEKDGTTDTYHFDQVQTNPPLNEAFFVFDAGKYPGVDIIDMR